MLGRIKTDVVRTAMSDIRFKSAHQSTVRATFHRGVQENPDVFRYSNPGIPLRPGNTNCCVGKFNRYRWLSTSRIVAILELDVRSERKSPACNCKIEIKSEKSNYLRRHTFLKLWGVGACTMNSMRIISLGAEHTMARKATTLRTHNMSITLRSQPYKKT